MQVFFGRIHRHIYFNMVFEMTQFKDGSPKTVWIILKNVCNGLIFLNSLHILVGYNAVVSAQGFSKNDIQRLWCKTFEM